MNNTDRKNDIFMIQVRLFRLAQIKWNLSPEDCDEIFKKYNVNAYIETCYEEYHVQGDDANLLDIESYIENRKALNDSKK